jgi:hypothetical protein
LLQQSQAAVVDQDTTILTTPNFITSDYWIAARSESKEQSCYYNTATFLTFNCNNSYAKPKKQVHQSAADDHKTGAHV